MPDFNNIELHIKVTFQDFLEIVFGRVLNMMGIAFGVLGIISLAFIKEGYWDFLFIALALLAVWSIIYSVIMYIRAKSHYSSNILLAKDLVYTFTEDMLEIRGESYVEKNALNSFYKLVERKSYFLLLPSKSTAYVIPKRFFVSSDQINEFKGLLKSHHL